MSIFGGNRNQAQQPMQPGLLDPRSKLQELQQNPSATLAQAGLSVPASCRTSEEVLTHLVQSGQVPTALYNRAARLLGLPISGQR
jgi:hypothetical protein